MSHSLSTRRRPAAQYTPQSNLQYLQELGQQAAALDSADLQAARIALDAGITPEQAREDAEHNLFLAPLAGAMERLTALAAVR